jgi:hypothetical protein
VTNLPQQINHLLGAGPESLFGFGGFYSDRQNFQNQNQTLPPDVLLEIVKVMKTRAVKAGIAPHVAMNTVDLCVLHQ